MQPAKVDVLAVQRTAHGDVMAESTPTTAKDFEYFKARCESWIKFLGLLQWRVVYAHEELDGHKAEISYDLDGSIAGVSLSTDWFGEPVSDGQLDSTAFHEIIHLLFAPLGTAAHARYTTEDAVDNAEHQVVRTIQNSLYPCAIRCQSEEPGDAGVPAGRGKSNKKQHRGARRGSGDVSGFERGAVHRTGRTLHD